MRAPSDQADRDTAPSLTRNAVSNLAGLFAYLAIAFFLSPYIVRSLGDARYGAWSLVAEIVGYYSLLDLGLRNAVTFFVANYAAKGEHERLGSSIASAFWVLAVAGSALALAGVGLAGLFPYIFESSQVDIREVLPAMAIMSITIGLSLPMDVFAAALTGYRRMDLVNVAEVVSRGLVALGIYLALGAGGGLIAMSLIQSAGRVLAWLGTYVWMQRVSGGISLSPRHFSRNELRSLGRLGSMNVVMSLASVLINRADLVVVGIFLGVRWVAFYNIGRMLVEYASQITSSVSRAFMPHLAHLHSQNEMLAVRRLFLAGAKYNALVSFPLAACLGAFGPSFLGLWMGRVYVTGDVTHRSDIVMLVLVGAHVCRWTQAVVWQAVASTGEYRHVMWLNVAEAIANLALSLVLVRTLGLLGVALGTMIPMAVSYLWLMPAHVLKRFDVRFRDYFAEALRQPLLVGVLVLAFARTLVVAWYPSSWPLMFAQAFATVAVWAVLAYLLGLAPGERAEVRHQLARAVRAV